MPDQDTIYLSEYIREKPRHHLDDKSLDKTLSKLHTDVSKGFEDAQERADAIMDYWDCFNCKRNANAMYSGESQIFLPLIHNAVKARKTRFVNQIFPQSKRHVECVSTGGDNPQSILSLVEHYITATKLRTQIVPALCVNGDVEGQYNLYVSWREFKRTIKRRVTLPVDPHTGKARGPEDQEAIILEKVTDGVPDVEVIHDADLLVRPATSDSIEDALNRGGSATILRRYTKTQIETLKDEGTLDKQAAEDYLKDVDQSSNKTGRRNTGKKLVEDQGQKVAMKEVELYETWTYLKLRDRESKKGKPQGGKRTLSQLYHLTSGVFVGCRESPYWNGKCPILSCPVDKLASQFKGDSQVKFCADMQYKANDAVNIAMDSAMYSLMPIVMTNPDKNPRVASMIMTMAAIWECSPQDTQVIQFPDLWEKGFMIANASRDIILQTLSVTPAAITQGSGAKKKPTQADIANEQAVDILTTADAVTTLEEGQLTPLIQWFIDLDYQFRDRALTVKKYGPMGVESTVEEVEPLQTNERFEFRWLGVEAARQAQQIQQQIAGLNILRGIPPQMYEGYRLNLGPMIATFVEATYGPKLAQQTFIPLRKQLSLDPHQENIMLTEGFEVPPSPMDDDAAHMREHMAFLQQAGPLADQHKQLQAHIRAHMVALAQKSQAHTQAGQPGTPGGAGPGVPGQPRPGAQPMRLPQGTQNPPGAIPQDRVNPQRGARLPRGNAA